MGGRLPDGNPSFATQGPWGRDCVALGEELLALGEGLQLCTSVSSSVKC